MRWNVLLPARSRGAAQPPHAPRAAGGILPPQISFPPEAHLGPAREGGQLMQSTKQSPCESDSRVESPSR